MKYMVFEGHVPLRESERPFCDEEEGGFYVEALRRVFSLRERVRKSIGEAGRVIYGPCQSDENGSQFSDLICLEHHWPPPPWMNDEFTAMRSALGEIFDAGMRLFWVGECKLVPIGGGFVAGLFAEHHGLVVKDLARETRQRTHQYVSERLKMTVSDPLARKQAAKSFWMRVSISASSEASREDVDSAIFQITSKGANIMPCDLNAPWP